MDGDEGLKLGPLNLCQVLRCHLNQLVKNIQEMLVRSLHDLFVSLRLCQSFLGIAGPNHLDAQQTDLCGIVVLKVQQLEALLSDSD